MEDLPEAEQDVTGLGKYGAGETPEVTSLDMKP